MLSPADAGLIELGAAVAMRRNGYRRSDVSTRPERTDLVRFTKRVAGQRKRMIRRCVDDARLRRRFPMRLAAAD